MIDLFSDTMTKPSPAMRQAMASAEVGDETFGEDPTVNDLCEFAAGLLGKEAAIFVPSATMANQIAIKILTQPGDELICHENAHIRLYEGGAPAALSGVSLWTLPGERGILTPAQIRGAVRPDDPHYPRTRLVCLENTHNKAGGCVWKLEEIVAVEQAAREFGLAMHLDGSRLMNAATATGVPASRIASSFDTVTLCLSKGLGAPVGAILATSAEHIKTARRWKKVFGGMMRQAGIIAAGGLYALQNNIDRLSEDHENAAILAEGLSQIPGVRLDPYPETNIVYCDISATGLSDTEAAARLKSEGVRTSGGYGAGYSRLRFVTHLDISREQTLTAVEVCRRAFA